VSGDSVEWAERVVRNHGLSNSEVGDACHLLLDEIERLRAAGDAMAEVVAWWGEGTSTGDAVLAAWEEVRHD
jgi:hypothetical protein